MMSIELKDFVKMALNDLHQKSDEHTKRHLESLTEEDIDLITEKMLKNEKVTTILFHESYNGIHDRVIEKINKTKTEDKRDLQAIRKGK